MKILTVAFLSLASIAFVLFTTIGLSYNGFINDANQFEVSIKAQYTDNKNVYDNGFKKVKEMAQVPAMQEEQLEKLYVAAIGARQYDKGGALFKFITEQNPQMNQDTFIKIQQAVEEYRNSFQRVQTELIARKQSYESFLTATTSGRFNNMLAGMFGSPFPRIDLTKFDIITSDKTEADFANKKSEPLNLKQ